MAADLKGAVEEARSASLRNTGAALHGLQKAATALEMTESATRLTNAATALEQDTFRLIMVGRFKTGKSTMMNALLGKPLQNIPSLPSGAGPMPVDDLPCTATLTSIYYSDKPQVRVYRFDGKVEEWSLERYLRDAVCRAIEEENEEFFGPIREFEVGFPVELCQSGVTMLDSPGVDDVPQRSEVTRQAVQNCDAAIVVYRSDVLAGQSERDFVSRYVEGAGVRVFTVINRWGSRAVDDRFKAFVWNRLVTEQRSGAKFSTDSDFEFQDIFFVDALRAHEGKLSDNLVQTAESGLAHLEEKLGDFLLKERHSIRLQKFAQAGEAQALLIDQQIAQRLKALDADERQLEEAYARVQPQLAQLRARRDLLPTVFDRHRAACHAALRASFTDETVRLKAALPDLLAAQKMQTLDTLKEVALSAVNRPKIISEATQIAQRIITEQIGVWSRNPVDKPGAQAALQAPLAELFQDVDAEVARIQSGFDAINFELSGWQTAKSTVEGETASLTGQLFDSLGANRGVAVGNDWRSAVGATAGAMAGFVGGFVGSFITIAVLSLTASVAAPIVLIGTAVAALVGGFSGSGAGVEPRIKAGVVRAMADSLDRLPEEAGPQLDKETNAALDALQTEVMSRVSGVIDEQERGLVKIREINRQDHAEKIGMRLVLEDTADQVSDYRATLRTVLRGAA